MKLAIILLAFCSVYVSVTHQQQQFMPGRYPLSYYYTSYYDSPQWARNHLIGPAPFYVVRKNYIQPYSSPNPSFEDQVSVVIYF